MADELWQLPQKMRFSAITTLPAAQDFTSVPVTGGAYIRGINNLYEYDCGSVSGWMYKVNGDFPNVGCSDYKLSEGDSIEFLYSCDLGADIGNIYLGD